MLFAATTSKREEKERKKNFFAQILIRLEDIQKPI